MASLLGVIHNGGSLKFLSTVGIIFFTVFKYCKVSALTNAFKARRGHKQGRFDTEKDIFPDHEPNMSGS
jgi:hypothetical protein